MPYDPQRSHRRPRLADDAPAPIDALLGDGPEPPVATDAGHESNGDRSRPAPPAPELPTAPSGTSGRPRVALVAIAILVLVLVVAWVRRRR
jgi:hypothetical protein